MKKHLKYIKNFHRFKNELQQVDFKSIIDSLYTEKGKISSYDLIMEEEWII